eukprot:6975017-Alexandrium_andersonii.AAC.1
MRFHGICCAAIAMFLPCRIPCRNVCAHPPAKCATVTAPEHLTQDCGEAPLMTVSVTANVPEQLMRGCAEETQTTTV